MPEFIIEIHDKLNHIEYAHHFASNDIEARMTVFADDQKLCCNSFVILENVPFYTRQIIKIMPV
jgi:hypothetical protein